MTNIEKMLEIAKSYLGVCEGTNAHKQLINDYNRYAETCGEYIMTYYDPWCAAFASLCAARANVKLPFSASCPRMLETARRNGTFKKEPKTGGYILFCWDGSGVPGHVGIVEAVGETLIGYIEGNANNRVLESSMNRKSSSILGYIWPEESEEPNPEPGQTEEPAEPVDPGKLPTIKYGDVGASVKALQSLLVLRGYSVGRWGIDGENGPDTTAAIRRATFERLNKEFDYAPPALFVSLING